MFVVIVECVFNSAIFYFYFFTRKFILRTHSSVSLERTNSKLLLLVLRGPNVNTDRQSGYCWTVKLAAREFIVVNYPTWLLLPRTRSIRHTKCMSPHCRHCGTRCRSTHRIVPLREFRISNEKILFYCSQSKRRDGFLISSPLMHVTHPSVVPRAAFSVAMQDLHIVVVIDCVYIVNTSSTII